MQLASIYLWPVASAASIAVAKTRWVRSFIIMFIDMFMWQYIIFYHTIDISTDLIELSRTPVAVVCAGVKSILDIPKTLEFLETHVRIIIQDAGDMSTILLYICIYWMRVGRASRGLPNQGLSCIFHNDEWLVRAPDAELSPCMCRLDCNE